MFVKLRRRRWFRFGLAGSIVLIALTAALVANHVRWIHQRREFLAREQAAWEAKGASYIISQEEAQPSWLLGLLDERGYDSVFIAIDAVTPGAIGEPERRRIDETRHMFPEAEIFAFHIDDDPPGAIRSVFGARSLRETSEFSRAMDDLRNGDW